MSLSPTALLEQQHNNLEGLLRLLEEERRVLELRDVDKLQASTQTKQSLLAQIAELDQTFKTAAMVEALRQPELAEKKQQIEALLERCKQQNEINGKLIELGIRQTEQLSQVLIRARSHAWHQLALLLRVSAVTRVTGQIPQKNASFFRS